MVADDHAGGGAEVFDARILYDGAAGRPRQAPADQASVRRNNLGLVLRHLRDHGPRSRARIAQETGLNKATVSSLVGELAQRGLVAAGAVDRAGSVGRPGLMVHLDGQGVCGIGLELNVDYLAVLVLDLRGEVLDERRVAFDVPAAGPVATLDAMAAVVREAIDRAAARGATPVGLTVAVPGLAVGALGMVALAPNIGWERVAVADGLRARLPGTELPIRVENDANLSAIAECALGSDAGTPDLLYLSGKIGVGGGVIVGGELLRGASGFSGEVGHMSLGSPDHVCGCGRRGCWETVVGLTALLRAATDEGDPVLDPAGDLDLRLAEVERRAEAGDERTLAALHRVGTELGIGASVLINVVNPQVLVLGGYYAVLGRFLLAPMTAQLRERVFGPDVAGARVALSTLGFSASVRGGAHVALEAVFTDPTIVPPAGPEPAPGLPEGALG